MSNPETTHLSQADQSALDALVEHGFDAGAVPDDHRERAAHIARLLSPLDALKDNPQANGSDLTARTLRRIERDGRPPTAPLPPRITDLSEGDRRALDALVQAGLDSQNVPADHRPRAERLAATLSLLDHMPEERTGDLLAARTLQRIERRRQQDRFTQQIEGLAAGGGGFSGFRLSDAAAAAAVFLISISLLWPMLSSARGTARQIACQSNLAAAGLGLTTYGADHEGAMPATQANLGDPWWLTGRFDSEGNAQSNSAHLYVMVRDGYARMGDLCCPENPDATHNADPKARDWAHNDACSFSYQNQYTSRKPRIGRGPTIAALADKNPFFAPGTYRFELEHDTNSRNHTHRGQNVLLTSGEVLWLTRPVLRDNDNIFHAGDKGLDYYTGVEAPAHEADSFLVQ